MSFCVIILCHYLKKMVQHSKTNDTSLQRTIQLFWSQTKRFTPNKICSISFIAMIHVCMNRRFHYCIDIKFVFKIPYFCLLGYESHKFIRYHKRPTICVVHSAVLRFGTRSFSSWSAKSEWDGRSTATAKWFPVLSGQADWDSASY